TYAYVAAYPPRVRAREWLNYSDGERRCGTVQIRLVHRGYDEGSYRHRPGQLHGNRYGCQRLYCYTLSERQGKQHLEVVVDRNANELLGRRIWRRRPPGGRWHGPLHV